VEETVEVVRNHEGGPSEEVGTDSPKQAGNSVRERTPLQETAEGRSLKNPVGGA